MALEKEMETFTRRLPELLTEPENEGLFALVHGDELAGVYPTFEAALSVGYEKYELEPFLVREVTEHQPVHYFSRTLKCPT